MRSLKGTIVLGLLAGCLLLSQGGTALAQDPQAALERAEAHAAVARAAIPRLKSAVTPAQSRFDAAEERAAPLRANARAAAAQVEAPAAAIDCDGARTTVVVQFVSPDAIVPERRPARTPTGKRTLKKRTKTEINSLYMKALGSNVLATVKETFAVAPGTATVQMLVIRHEIAKDGRSELAAIYVGEFDRPSFAGADGSRDPARSLSMAGEAALNLKGKTETVSPIDLKRREDLAAVLAQLEDGLRG